MSLKRVITKVAELALDEVPGARSIHILIEEGVHKRRERLGREYLENLAKLLAAKQNVDAGALILEHLPKEHAAEAVERGYEAMMQATDVQARVCIGALVAEYVNNARAPDRTYRRVAGIFGDATADDLAVLRQLGSATLTVAPAANWKDGQVVVATSDKGTVLVSARASGGEKHRATAFAESPSLKGVLQMLMRHGLARAWTGWGGDDDGHSEELIFDSGEPLQAVAILVACIEATATTEGTGDAEQ